jgi:hypothetical protein
MPESTESTELATMRRDVVRLYQEIEMDILFELGSDLYESMNRKNGILPFLTPGIKVRIMPESSKEAYAADISSSPSTTDSGCDL